MSISLKLPVLLNSINNNSVNSAKINEAIANVDNISLVKFKSVIKSCMIDVYSYYCNTLTVIFVKFSVYLYLYL